MIVRQADRLRVAAPMVMANARGLLDAQFKIQGLGMEGVSLTIWGKNLTNKHYVVRAVDFGQLGMGTVIYGDPRTFGATLDLTF